MVRLINISSTILAAVLCIAVLIHAAHLSQEDINSCVFVSEDKSRRDTVYVKRCRILETFLFLLAVFLRIYKMGFLPDALNQDSALAAVEANSLLMHGTDYNGVSWPFMFGALNNTQMSILMSWLMIPWIHLLGMNRISVVIPTMLLNIGGMFSGFWFVKDAFGHRFAAIYLLIAIANPWDYIQSRWPLDANLLPQCFMIAVVLLFVAVEKQRKWLIIISTAIFGLCHYCYGVSLFIIPLFLLITFIWLERRRIINILIFSLSVMVYLLISWPFYMTMLINAFHWNSIRFLCFTIPTFPAGARQGDILLTGEHPGRQLFLNLFSIVKVLILQKDELLWSYVPGFGTMMPFMVSFMLVGLFAILSEQIYIRRNAHRNDSESAFSECINCSFSYIILEAWLVCILLCGAMIKDVNSTRLNIAIHFCLISSAVGMSYVSSQIGEILKQPKAFLRITMQAIPIVMTVIMSAVFLIDYFTIYQERFFDAEYAYSGNFTAALEKAHEYPADRYVITPDAQYTGAADVSEADTMFIWNIDSWYRLGWNNQGPQDLHTPYSETFIYANACDLLDVNAELNMNTVYVSMGKDTKLFSRKLFRVYEYGRFCVAVPASID